MQQGKVL
ncbi:hypothetical protein VCHC28A1_3294, partial [Vibrio cholerae HC-28A1]